MKMINTENRDLEWLRERTEYLAEFMTPERCETLSGAIAERTRYMTILSENTYDSQNSSALVRHCEAFGVQSLHAVEMDCHFKVHVDIARGSEKWIELNRYATTNEAVARLKSEGYRIVATTPHREDTTPEDFDVEAGKFALVFGAEHTGISDEVITEADEFLKIPMCGMVESLNVSASAAILIYMLSQRMRLNLDGDVWRLSEQEKLELLYRWMKQSVRDSEGLLKRKFSDY